MVSPTYVVLYPLMPEWIKWHNRLDKVNQAFGRLQKHAWGNKNFTRHKNWNLLSSCTVLLSIFWWPWVYSGASISTLHHSKSELEWLNHKPWDTRLCYATKDSAVMYLSCDKNRGQLSSNSLGN